LSQELAEYAGEQHEIATQLVHEMDGPLDGFI